MALSKILLYCIPLKLKLIQWLGTVPPDPCITVTGNIMYYSALADPADHNLT